MIRIFMKKSLECSDYMALHSMYLFSDTVHGAAIDAAHCCFSVDYSAVDRSSTAIRILDMDADIRRRLTVTIHNRL